MSSNPHAKESPPSEKKGPQDDQEPGTNATEREPDPNAQPLPDGHHKYIPRSPYTAGH